MRRLELGNRRALAALERVNLRPAVAQEAIGIDHLQHFDLLAVWRGRMRGRLQGPLFGALGKRGNDRIVGHIRPGIVARARQDRQLVEIIPPGGLDRGRIGEISVVQLFDIRRIRAKQIGVIQHLLHHGSTCFVG